MKRAQIARLDQTLPAFKVSNVGLAAHAAPEPRQVMFERGPPIVKGRRREMSGQFAVQHPRAVFRPCEFGSDGAAGDSETRPGEELADAGLVNAAGAG